MMEIVHILTRDILWDSVWGKIAITCRTHTRHTPKFGDIPGGPVGMTHTYPHDCQTSMWAHMIATHLILLESIEIQACKDYTTWDK